MVVITVNGAYVAYDATSDVVVVVTVNGAECALQEVAPAANAPTGVFYGPLYGPLGGPVG